jgi:hypothetical protein
MRTTIDPPSYDLGPKVDLSNVGEVLERLDAEDPALGGG